MKHLKTINEYLNPIIEITKGELGVGIKEGDKLVIYSLDKPNLRKTYDIYYFLYKDDVDIHVVDESGEEKIFNLDELNNTWEISRINDQEIVVESKK